MGDEQLKGRADTESPRASALDLCDMLWPINETELRAEVAAFIASCNLMRPVAEQMAKLFIKAYENGYKAGVEAPLF